MYTMSSYRISSYFHQINNSNLLSVHRPEFIRHGLRNWFFQTEGSFVHKRVRSNFSPASASYLGNVNESHSDNAKNHKGDNIQVSTEVQIKNLIEEIKHMLNSIGEGRSSVSAYDTAWISFIPDTNNTRPLFPSCLQWIVNNQLGDGSWGEEQVFCIYDRLLNTLACVVALTLWNTSLHKRNKGVMFIKENISKLETAEVENMTCGFEFVFPALLEKAQPLDIDLPYENPFIKDIFARREIKFTRIPKDLMHTVPTTLLFSLEGLRDLDWKRLLKLQMQDGSFLTSPASTAIYCIYGNK